MNAAADVSHIGAMGAAASVSSRRDDASRSRRAYRRTERWHDEETATAIALVGVAMAAVAVLGISS